MEAEDEQTGLTAPFLPKAEIDNDRKDTEANDEDGDDDSETPTICTLGRIQRLCLIISESTTVLTGFCCCLVICLRIDRFVPFDMKHQHNSEQQANYDLTSSSHPTPLTPIHSQFLYVFLAIWLLGESIGLFTYILLQYHRFWQTSPTSMITYKLTGWMQYYFTYVGTAGFFISFMSLYYDETTEWSHFYLSLMLILILVAVAAFLSAFARDSVFIDRPYRSSRFKSMRESSPLGQLAAVILSIPLLVGGGVMVAFYPLYLAWYLLWLLLFAWWPNVLPNPQWSLFRFIIGLIQMINDAFNWNTTMAQTYFRRYQIFYYSICGAVITLVPTTIGIFILASAAMATAPHTYTFTEVCDEITSGLGPLWITTKVIQVVISVILPLLRLFAIAKLRELTYLLQLYPALQSFSDLLDYIDNLIDVMAPKFGNTNNEMINLRMKRNEIHDEIAARREEMERRIKDIVSTLVDYDFGFK